MRTYRVQQITDGEVVEETEIQASSADEAVSKVFAKPLTRGDRSMKVPLRAKVYFGGAGEGLTMVRYHEKAEE